MSERSDRSAAGDGDVNEVIIVPVADELTAPYWEGAAGGELRLQRCRACGTTWHPPLPRCPRCRDPETPEWYAASGRGVVESSTVVHQAAHPAFARRVPYVVVAVRLVEGPLVVANVVAGADDPSLLTTAPAVGTVVTVVFTTIAPGIVLPQFTVG